MVELLSVVQTPLVKLIHQVVPKLAGSVRNVFRVAASIHALMVRISIQHWLKSKDKVFVELFLVEFLEMSFHHFFFCLG